MGGKNADTFPPNPPWQNPQGWVCGLRNALGHLGWGSLFIAPMMSDGKNAAHFAYGWYAMSRSLWCIANGQPPAKPHWAGGP